MNQNLSFLALIVVIALGFGCAGEQFAHSVSGKMTPSGKWTLDDTLYRGYDVSLEEGYAAAVEYAQQKGTVTRQMSDVDWARVQLTYDEAGLERKLRIFLIKPKDAALDIGVHVDDGDRIASGKLLDELEEIIPGKRVYPMSTRPAEEIDETEENAETAEE